MMITIKNKKGGLASTKGGFAMITVVTLFLFLSMSFLVGVSDPILRQDSVTKSFLNSRKSYLLAESGVEDVIYRVKNNKQVFATENLSLDGGTVSTITTDSSGTKTINADASNNTLIRKVETVLKVGVGESFHYGVQSGQGGFVINNNAIVNGNVYSNGPINGKNGATVTGSVISASSSPSGSLINNVLIGTNGVGDATANSVTSSTVAGGLYCKIGSGNNKSCNTSYVSPLPADFPVSDGMISQWKSDALVGGVIDGNYTISSDSFIGPRKINGNLIVNNNITVTLNGTLWVTGNISINNGANIKLASSYGTNSGLLLSDGHVSVSNGANFAGSGQAGSSLMVLTTSDCPLSLSCNGNYAMDVSNNVGAVILNAQKGTINMHNNVGVNAATANTINFDNNSVINYVSGLTNVNFTNGPGGSWNINSWRETE